MSLPVKCLVVDDVAENLIALEALLKADDVEVLLARSGVEALELLLVHDIALALIDVQMPEMDGFELAELMRGSERSRQVPIVFVTAASRESQRMFRGYDCGAVDFLFKPVEPRILRQKADIFFTLHRRNRELAQAVQVRDDVLAVVSHDLRDPLNVVSMAGSILRQAASARSDAQLTDLSSMLQRSVDRMQRLIGDLLDMATLRTGTLSIARQSASVAGLLAEALDSQRPAAQARRIELTSRVELRDDALSCDPQRLLQVFGNLLGNAIKFCEPDARVQLSARDDGFGTVHFVVEDSGPGIAEGDLPHLFDPYWTARHKARGHGLGLYITRGIVEAHGGRIWASNRDGGGAALHFTLPRV